MFFRSPFSPSLIIIIRFRLNFRNLLSILTGYFSPLFLRIIDYPLSSQITPLTSHFLSRYIVFISVFKSASIFYPVFSHLDLSLHRPVSIKLFFRPFYLSPFILCISSINNTFYASLPVFYGQPHRRLIGLLITVFSPLYGPCNPLLHMCSGGGGI